MNVDVQQALSALGPHLASAARWLPLLWWTTAGGIGGWLAAWAGLLVARPPLRGLAGGTQVHWTERARAGYPMQWVAAMSAFLAPVALGALAAAATGPASALPGAGAGLLAAVAACLGGLAARRCAGCGSPGFRLSFWADLGGEWCGLLLMAPHALVLIAMAFGIGPELDARDLTLASLGAVAFAACAHSSGLPLLRALGVARRDERLREIVDAVASRARVEVRDVWVVPWSHANALALPWSRQLVFSRRTLELLDDVELGAVAAHEIGHLAEPVSVKLSRSAALVAFFPLGLSQPAVRHWGLPGLAALVALAFGVLFAVASVARRMEHRADGVAHAHQGDECAFALALEKLYRANATPAVLAARKPSHPHLYDRLTAAGLRPDYPRPPPPSRLRPLAALVACILGLVLVGATALLVPRRAAEASVGSPGHAIWTVTDGRPWAIASRGYALVAEGSTREGIAWLTAAHALDPHDHHAGSFAAELLADAGDCESARPLLAEAQRRAGRDGRTCSWVEDSRAALDRCGD